MVQFFSLTFDYLSLEMIGTFFVLFDFLYLHALYWLFSFVSGVAQLRKRLPDLH